MIARLVLTKPDVKYPVKRQGVWGDVGVPLGLLYLGAFVRENNNVDVSVRDYRLEHALGKTRNFERDFSNANAVGAGACTCESPDALHILKQAKRMGKTTIMGGLYATFNAYDVLNTGFVDFVVRGEGESALSDLLKALNNKMPLDEVKGISYRKNGRVVHHPDQELIEDLNSLPIPAYDLIPVDEYVRFTTAPIYAGRGCPRTCKFCTLNEMWSFKHRKRSFDNILREIKMLRDFGFKRVHFKDENIALDRNWAIGLFRELEKAQLGVRFKAKSRINQIDEELLQQMMRAGLDTIHTGVESVSQKTLDRMGKEINQASIKSSFDLMLKNGCKVNPVYLFGYPGETEQDLRTNAEFIREIGQRQGVITYISFMTPHPGSSIEWQEIAEMDILTRDYSRYTHKQPVAVPISLLGMGGLMLMVEQYHEIVEHTGMQDVNPRIDPAYLEQVLKTRTSSAKYQEEVLVA